MLYIYRYIYIYCTFIDLISITYNIIGTDIHTILKQTEIERDKLLTFISSDMQKSASLLIKIEEMELIIKTKNNNEEIYTNDINKLNKLLTIETNKYQEYYDKYHHAINDFHELQRKQRIVELGRFDILYDTFYFYNIYMYN